MVLLLSTVHFEKGTKAEFLWLKSKIKETGKVNGFVCQQLLNHVEPFKVVFEN